MKKLIPIGLVALLIYHTLAYALVCLSGWWQAEHDLSERLMVYRSTDSLVEFQVPLKNAPDIKAIARTTSDGFRYHGHYYGVVSLEVRQDTLYIAGLEVKSQSLWPDDLLSFLNDHLTGTTESQQQANKFLKFLLKEYSPTPRAIFSFCFANWRETPGIRAPSFTLTTRALPVYAPPPEA